MAEVDESGGSGIDPAAPSELRAAAGAGVGEVDADRLRSMVARRLFGTAADPVRIGRFAVLRRLGAGGMGVVYAAFDEQLDRKVAIKLLRGVDDPASRARLLREAQALARLSHPNVIQVYETGTHDGQVFVAMEFVKGQTLTRWKPEARLDELLEKFIQAGRGLAAAHAAGLVHRDFKPDNVLVGEDGRVRVLDFGLARAAGEVGRDAADSRELHDAGVNPASEPLDALLTRTGAATGTPAYMSPEQHRGEATDPRTDQFSFCVALWERIYGVRPFPGRNLSQLALAVTEGHIADPPAGASAPGWLRRALLRGLSTDPGARWPDMDSLLDHLAMDRRRIWRRLAVVGALIGATGTAILVATTTPGAPRCPEPAAQLAGLWDGERADAVARAFEDTGAPYAQDAYRGVATILDAYARDWAEMQTETCELATAATRGGAIQGSGEGEGASGELLGRRMVCLSQRRQELRQLVGLLAEADEAAVRSAVQAASRLPDLRACANERSLLAYDSLEGEVDRGELESIGDLLARGRSRLGLGRYEDGLAFAQEAAARAEAAGHLPSQARAALLEGALRQRLGDYAGAQRELSRARRLGDRAGDDETRAEALIALVQVVGYHGGDSERAEVLAEDAWAALERLGDAPLLEARLHNHLGSLAGARAAWDDALAHQRRALEIRERELGHESPEVAISLNDLANALTSSGANAEAERMHRRALTIFESVLGPGHPHVAISLNNVANAIQAQAYPEGDVAAAARRAEPLYRRAIEIREGAFGPEHPLLATPYNNLAEALRNAGELDAAIEAYARAVAIKRKVHGDAHPRVSVSLTGLGQAHLARGEVDAARDHLEAARAGQADAEANPEYRAVTAFHLALTLAEADPERARALAEEAGRDYAAAGERFDADRARVEAFLAAAKGR